MKRLITNLLQIALTLALLYWVFRDPEKRAEMLTALGQAKPSWLIAAFLSLGAGFLLQVTRWRWLLLTQSIELPPLRIVRLYFIGLFFNIFLPGGTGGDLVKIFYAARETPDKKYGAAMSVILDRVFGMLALILLSGVICAVYFPILISTPKTQVLLSIMAAIFAASLAVVGAAWIVEAFRLAEKLPQWIPLRSSILELAAGFSAVARRPRTVLACIGISLPAHCLMFLCFYFVARAFSEPLGLAQIFTALPMIQTISSLPISFGGLGVREELFQQILGALYQFPAGIAVLISISGYALVVLWGLVGGVIYATYQSSVGGKVSLHAAQLAAEKVEHELESPRE